jgi:hypothetical protein
VCGGLHSEVAFKAACCNVELNTGICNIAHIAGIQLCGSAKQPSEELAQQ